MRSTSIINNIAGCQCTHGDKPLRKVYSQEHYIKNDLSVQVSKALLYWVNLWSYVQLLEWTKIFAIVGL